MVSPTLTCRKRRGFCLRSDCPI
ncbi:MAG: hypothetical protein CBC31_003735 [Verrucomicrobia bacterium TMED71]|nr:MAG: hypothetical protein CBC31_003735 [Verrucomicrobia bacterium TMED71]